MYQKFKKLCEANDKTEYRVTKDCGIAQSTMSDWRRGLYNPKADKIMKLANYFGVTMDYFYR